jgi:hypothetical protein
MPASPIERCLATATVALLALAVMPMRAAAAPPAEQPPAEQPPAEQPPAEQPPAEQPPAEQPPPSEPVVEESGLEPEVTEIEHRDAPSGGGIAGAIVDPDDPNATRAQSDLEGEALDGETTGVPDRLPRLQTAGWWMTFTAVALATSGGIFAGVAEVREDEAERLAYGFDLLTGRTTTYGPVADEYERLLAEGNTYQWVARGLIIAGGVALVASISLFTVDGVKRRNGLHARGTRLKWSSVRAARLQLDPGLGGFTLRF